MDEETTMKDELKKLNSNFEQLLASDKIKKFKLPSKGKLSKRDLKNNMATVIAIGENREIKFIKTAISEGTINFEGIPRIATTDYMLSYQGKPAIILPSWSVRPFSPVESYTQEVKDKMTAAGYKLLLNRIELGKVADKKKFGNWWIIPLILGVIIIGYLILS